MRQNVFQFSTEFCRFKCVPSVLDLLFFLSSQDHRVGILKNGILKEKALCGEFCI